MEREFLGTHKHVRNPVPPPPLPNGAFRIKRRSHVGWESDRSDHVPPWAVPLIAYLAAADPEFLLCPPRANSPRETETDSASIGSLLQDMVGNISLRSGNNTGRAARLPGCQAARRRRRIACRPPGRLAQETREPGQVSLDAGGWVANTWNRAALELFAAAPRALPIISCTCTQIISKPGGLPLPQTAGSIRNGCNRIRRGNRLDYGPDSSWEFSRSSCDGGCV